MEATGAFRIAVAGALGLKVGIVILAHTAFDRVEQVARHWRAQGCPVVIHVDKAVPFDRYQAFVDRFSDLEHVYFSDRFRCEWGTWGIVAASLSAAEKMLEVSPETEHVLLSSGSCVPLRPARELITFLRRRKDTDFIESANVDFVPWTIGGLDQERFTLRFPFAWRKNRFLFDRYVSLQRRLGVNRAFPEGITPHLGSQWWCLTRKTLLAILNDPARRTYENFFRLVWIPDESFFQTLVRKHSSKIESRSLTLSKFDFLGKPFMFYNDHLKLLTRSDRFMARKIWPGANAIYDHFLDQNLVLEKPDPVVQHRIDRVLNDATDRRERGRRGLAMQSRYVNDFQSFETCKPYVVFEGFAELFQGFEEWLAKTTNLTVHGHIFAKDRVEFEGRTKFYTGGLTDDAKIRDRNPNNFLRCLIWNTRAETQCFQFGPDDQQSISHALTRDRNARHFIVLGAWALPLYKARIGFDAKLVKAAELQRAQNEHLQRIFAHRHLVRTEIWTLAEFLDAPEEHLRNVTKSLTQPAPRISKLPPLEKIGNLGTFLQKLKNHGMNPYLLGDFPYTDQPNQSKKRPQPKRYRNIE